MANAQMMDRVAKAARGQEWRQLAGSPNILRSAHPTPATYTSANMVK